MPNPLDALAIRHRTDKSSRYHRYTDPYYQLLEPLRRKPLKIVEIGVQTGASLRMWADFFPRARIYGIDLDPGARAHQTRRIRISTGDQYDIGFLAAFKRRVGKVDLVIDDGSHRPEHQLRTLECLSSDRLPVQGPCSQAAARLSRPRLSNGRRGRTRPTPQGAGVK